MTFLALLEPNLDFIEFFNFGLSVFIKKYTLKFFKRVKQLTIWCVKWAVWSVHYAAKSEMFEGTNMFNRPGVAGAVLQSPSSLIDSFIH